MALEIFKYENKEVRTKVINDEAYFSLKDVCEILKLENTTKAKSRLNTPGVTTSKVGVQTGIKANGEPAIQQIEMTFINESNLYKLIFQSRKPEAEKFTEWVTSEVLPSIRRHGAYMTQDTLNKALTSPDFLIQLATNLKEEQEKNQKLLGEIEIKNQVIEELKPIKEYVDIILSSNECLTITQIAADYGLSAKHLNKVLEQERIQRKVNGQWILYKDYMNRGWTKSETVNIGNDRVKLQTKWTQKGRLKIHEILTELGYTANVDFENDKEQ